MSAIDLDELLRVHAAAFRPPWRAETWAVETDDGADSEVETILSPEEYPSEQIVAQVDESGVISTPGLENLARANAAAIAAAHNALPDLIERVKRAEAAVDCGQDGPCAIAPGCQRHWAERNRELVAERDALREVKKEAENVLLRLGTSYPNQFAPFPLPPFLCPRQGAPMSANVEGIKVELLEQPLEDDHLSPMASRAAKSAAGDLRYYSLPNVKREGWAIAVLHVTSGFFACDSDYGSYVYTWGSMGVRDTRQFLMSCDVHYLHSKFMAGKPDARELDVEASRAAIKKLIRKTWPKASNERSVELELLARADFDSEGAIALWYSESELPNHVADWHEDIVRVPNRQCVAFLEKVWPRLVALWKEELAAEGSRGSHVCENST